MFLISIANVPLNFGAYTNGSFISQSHLALEFTDPQLYAEFFAYGGGRPYAFSSLNVTGPTWAGTTTSGAWASPFTSTSTSTSATPAIATTNETPDPSLYQDKTIGGGLRSKIYGSSRWGSGLGNITESPSGIYTWAPQLSLQNPIISYPFGFWPIYWGNIPNSYSDSLPFKSYRFRPGGSQLLILASTGEDLTDRPYYYIIADEYTIEGLNVILKLSVNVGGCGMSDSSPVYYFSPEALAPNGTRTLMPTNSRDAPRTNFTLSPESALQYYRGSSAVLGTPEYVKLLWARVQHQPRVLGHDAIQYHYSLPQLL
jgi:hypothetical protein